MELYIIHLLDLNKEMGEIQSYNPLLVSEK